MDQRLAGHRPRRRDGPTDLPDLPLLAVDDPMGGRLGGPVGVDRGHHQRGQHHRRPARSRLCRQMVRPVPLLRHALFPARHGVAFPQVDLPL